VSWSIFGLHTYSDRTRIFPPKKTAQLGSSKHRLILASLPEKIVIDGAAFHYRLEILMRTQIRLLTSDMTNHSQPPVVSGLCSSERQSSGISEMADQADRVI
jgi:hypothetical protein